jgi:hypothetical protein
MLKPRILFLALASLLALWMFTGLAAAQTAAGDSVTVTGILEDGETGLELQVDGKVYLLEGFVPEEYLGRPVSVTGRLEKDEDGTLWLIVDDYGDPTD